MEAASGRRIDRAWNLARQHLAMLALPVRVRLRDRVHQKFRVGMEGLPVQIVLGCNLTHISQEHNTHPVRNEIDNRKIVSDKKIRKAVLLLQVLQQIQHLALHRYIQCRYRLIAYDQLRLQGNGPCYADALALSAGELVRVAVLEFRRHAHGLHQLQDLFRCLGAVFADMVGFQRLCDDIPHRHARIQAGVRILEHHLQPWPERPEAFLIH